MNKNFIFLCPKLVCEVSFSGMQAAMEKDIQALKEAGNRNDRKALDEWVH